MADQILDFKYRVSGQDALIRSLDLVEKKLRDVAKGYDRITDAARRAASVRIRANPFAGGVNINQAGGNIGGGGPAGAGGLGGPAPSVVNGSLSQIVNLHQTANSRIINISRGSTRIQIGLVGSVLGAWKSFFGSLVGLARGAFAAVSGTFRAIATTAQRAVQSGLSGIRSIADGALSVAGSVLSNVNRAFALARQVALYSAGIGAALAAAVGRSSIEADKNFKQLQAGLEVASGSAAGAAEEIRFLTEEADRLGVALGDIAPTYNSFLNAFKASGGSIEEARDLYLGVSQAIKATGGSSEQLQRALVAIGQSFGKGTLQAEELRGQLGEALPGAVALVAQNLGVTTAELGKMTEAGLDARKAFTGFGDFLQNRFGAAAVKASQGLTASRGRIANALLKLRQDIGAGLNEPLSKILDDVTAFITRLNQSGFGEKLGTRVGRGLLRFYEFVKKTASDLNTTFVLITRGYTGLASVLGRTLPGNDSFVGGYALAAKKVAELGPVGRTILRFQEAIVRSIANVRLAFRTIREVAQNARAAALDFFAGLTGGSIADSAFNVLETTIGLVRRLNFAISDFGTSGGFVSAGARVRDTFLSIRAAIYSLNGATGLGDFVKRSIGSFKRLVDEARYVGQAMVYAFRAIGTAIVALAPALDPITDRLGIYVPKLEEIRDVADLLARPFIYIGSILNQLAASGAIDRFAKKVAAAIERTIAAVKKARRFFDGIVSILGGIFGGEDSEDLKIRISAEFPDMPELRKVASVIADVRGAVIGLGRTVGKVITAVDLFWKEWGGTIKAIYDGIVAVAGLFAKFFGVENGSQVLILLTLASIALRLTGIGALITGLLGAVLPAVGTVLAGLAGAITSAVTGLIAGLGVLFTGPVGLVALVAAAIVGAVALIATNFGGIRDTLATIPSDMVSGFESAISKIGELFKSLGRDIRDAVLGYDPSDPFRKLDTTAKALPKLGPQNTFDVASFNTNRDAEIARMLRKYADDPNSPFGKRGSLPVQVGNGDPMNAFLREPKFLAQQRYRDQESDDLNASRRRRDEEDRRATTSVTIVDENGRNKYGEGTTFTTDRSANQLLDGMKNARIGAPRPAPIAMRPGA